jgi:hypothetical protein
MNEQPWSLLAMSRLFAQGIASPQNWYSPVFPILHENKVSSVVIAFPRSAPQVIPGHVLAPKNIYYLPYPEAEPIEVVDFDPKQFGLAENKIESPLSSLQVLQRLKHGEYTEITKQLHKIISRGFEQDYFVSHSSPTEQERADAKMVTNLLSRITPEGLSELYRAAGKLLFDWIKWCDMN